MFLPIPAVHTDQRDGAPATQRVKINGAAVPLASA